MHVIGGLIVRLYLSLSTGLTRVKHYSPLVREEFKRAPPSTVFPRLRGYLVWKKTVGKGLYGAPRGQYWLAKPIAASRF